MSNEQEKVDLIASGYEWICPDCGKLNKLVAIPSSLTVDCADCGQEYEVDNIHAALE